MRKNYTIRKGKKTSTIVINLRNGDYRFRKNTPIQIPTHLIKEWDSKQQRFKLPSKLSNAIKINTKLNQLSSMIDSVIEYFYGSQTTYKNLEVNLNEVFSKLFFENKLCENPKPQALINDSSFIAYFKYYIDFYKENPSYTSKKPLTKGTLRTYRNSMNFINNFLLHIGTPPLDFLFDDVTKDFYFDLLSFGKNKGYTQNYLGTIIQKIKTVMRASLEDGKHTNRICESKFFCKLKENVDSVYLKKSEIIKIRDVILKTDYEKDVRDVFLIGCFTGMRLTDLLEFVNTYDEKQMNFKNIDSYDFTQSKTGNVAIIRVSKPLIELLEKRQYILPKITNQSKFNQFIKIICKRAKIDYLVNKKTSQGEEKVPKYKLVSCHTARRSFCTNAFLTGAPLAAIMLHSGHKSEKVFLDYVKASSQEKARHFKEYDLLGM
jgi:hypothetical protein